MSQCSHIIYVGVLEPNKIGLDYYAVHDVGGYIIDENKAVILPTGLVLYGVILTLSC